MERIDLHRARVARLGTALAERDLPQTVQPSVEPQVEDAAALAKAEQALRWDEAERRGYEAGMARAKQEIADAVNKAELRATAELRSKSDLAAQRIKEFELRLSGVGTALHAHEEALAEAAAEVAFVAFVRCYGEEGGEKSVIKRLVDNVLAERKVRPVVVHLNPVDRETISTLELGEEVRLLNDPTVSSGAMRLESLAGQYETSVRQRIEAIAAALWSTTEEPLS